MDRPDPPVEIRQTLSTGRALVSTRPIHPGAIILTAPPLLLLPSLSHLQSVCTHCLRRGEPRACTRCRSAYYCGASCQRAHWQAIHARECKALAKVQAAGRGFLPTPVRVLVQVLLKEDLERQVAGLEGHAQAWREGGKWADVEMMAMGACAYSGVGTGQAQVKKACELMCKIQTNAFNWSDSDSAEVGVFLEPTLAMMNHSCMPNAMVEVIGRSIILRAETAIQAGDEIEISYTDYTWPKNKRAESLVPYQFQCHCVRCRDNLNIYQACALSSNIDLNKLSLAPEIYDVDRHPAIVDKNQSFLAVSESEKLSMDTSFTPSPEGRDSQQAVLRDRYRRCKLLVDNDMWAIHPLPTTIMDISTFYNEGENWACALATACLVATACDPYRFTAPFHPIRVKGILLIAKVLSQTAADTAAMGTSANTVINSGSFKVELQGALVKIDQVALCELLLLLILRLAPFGYPTESDVITSAREMLRDIGQLPGREKERSLIASWAEEPESDQSQAFFKYAVVDPVHALAALGKTALVLDFGI